MPLTGLQRIGRVLFVGAFVACALLARSTPAHAQFKIDHFKCYESKGQPVNAPLLLQDQFDRQIDPTFREKVLVTYPVRFCNPVEKTRLDIAQVTPITNPESHLTFYRILVDDPVLAPTRRVVIGTQFGKKTIYTFGQEVLAVPSAKDDEPPFHDLDHFKCYRAYSGAINRDVALRDQFGEQRHTRVGKAFLFCNPTEKIHATTVTPITNEADHLACFQIYPAPFSRDVRARNQFGTATIDVGTVDVLCLPATKIRAAAIH